MELTQIVKQGKETVQCTRVAEEELRYNGGVNMTAATKEWLKGEFRQCIYLWRQTVFTCGMCLCGSSTFVSQMFTWVCLPMWFGGRSGFPRQELKG